MQLSSIFSRSGRTHHPVVLLRSSLAQTCLPVLRCLLDQGEPNVLLLSLLYPAQSLIGKDVSSQNVRSLDWTSNVTGFSDDQNDPRLLTMKIIRTDIANPLTVIIDSVDTLLANLGSITSTYAFLDGIASLIKSSGNSQLILHAQASCPLIPMLSQTRFSPSLAILSAHPPALLHHLSTDYMTPPPPLTALDKFMGVFIPIAEREYESEKLVFGSNGEGNGGGEIVVEVLTRDSDGSGRRKGVERTLEGWSIARSSSCELSDLESLRPLFKRKKVTNMSIASATTHDASFNLDLTPAQQLSRSQVPLPYAHDNTPSAASIPTGAILYDPDSADDIDDDDPDEDLDL